MIVQLSRLTFDPGPGGSGALLLRRDGTTVAAPGAVAFALIPTAGQQLTLTADFAVSDPEGPSAGQSVWIRARALDAGRAILGDVAARQVPLPAAGGHTGPVQMTIVRPAFHQEGIGRYDVLWTWEARVDGTEAWVTFEQTHHVVFVTLDVPGEPWTQDPIPANGRSLPWTRALEAACDWAAGLKQGASPTLTRKKVTRRIEAALYALGDAGLLEYDGHSTLVVGRDPGTYQASSFLDVIDGTASSLPVKMNCSDCAVTVAVFANLLGAGASLLRVDREPGPLHLNDFKRIGANQIFSSQFAYHDIAVRGGGYNAQVFDATLKPDWDVTAGRDFKLTQGRRRGPRADTGGKSYLQRLLEPGKGQWDDFTLDPVTMPALKVSGPTVKRAVMAVRGISAPLSPVTRRHQTLVRRIEKLAQPPAVDVPAGWVIPAIKVPGLRIYDRVNAPPDLGALAPLVRSSAEFRYVAVEARRAGGGARRAGRAGDRRFRMSVAWSPTAADARRAMAWLMTRFAERLGPPRSLDGARLGDVAFGSARMRVLFLVRGNVFVRVASIGRTPASAESVARAADGTILTSLRRSAAR